MEIEEQLKPVLRIFGKHAKTWISNKEKDSSAKKDKAGNIHLTEDCLKSFCSEEADLFKEIIPNKSLERLSEVLSKNYSYLLTRDIYFALPHIFMNVFNFLMWEREDINMTYKTGLGFGTFQSQLVLRPKGIKPKLFSEFYEGEGLKMMKDIMSQTLEDADCKYGNVHFTFQLDLSSKIISNDQELEIGKRLELQVKNNSLSIKGKYSGNPYIALNRLSIDLETILSLLEMCGVLHIEDTDKQVGRKTMKGCMEDGDCIKFSYDQKGLKNTRMDQFHVLGQTYNEHFKKFKGRAIASVPIHYFALLSDKYDRSSLRIAPQFFSSENFRFPRTEFLNYWTALEILLGNPRNDIASSLETAYGLFYPEEESLDRKKKTIPHLWKIRNQMIHNGLIDIDQREVWEIKKIVEALFNKLLLASMTDKFLFEIQPNPDPFELECVNL